MNKYYKLTKETLVYSVVVILNPGFKWGYFEKVWEEHPNWVRVAKI